ncbi:hypothetical protein QKT49_gp410 [Acanthamoeba castellanii medusavirus]|uniref:Uncharacterized protein n=1 Tax=Acanthamoeba castellanii medusavirus J1 TaxID=3114988 RepID=A0A3T1CWZ4_9VIRU|nr:hypothetical protein QKT49_gp410 [Acanthamoeba castellanii medusavirus]BBI30353.1 hypothetical protein [Acanthamoeba castellanii medusavirus J1]
MHGIRLSCMERFHHTPNEYEYEIDVGSTCVVCPTRATPEDEFAQRFVVTQVRERFRSGCPKRIIIEHAERRENCKPDWQRTLYYSTSKKRWFCKAIDGLRHPVWDYHFATKNQ